jgi:hypothetical protein
MVNQNMMAMGLFCHTTTSSYQLHVEALYSFDL